MEWSPIPSLGLKAGPAGKGGDGVVKYSSAHIDGVESEKIVNRHIRCRVIQKQFRK